MHWDKFTQGHISFITWAALYFTTPFLVLGVWAHNRGEDTGARERSDPVVPPLARMLAGLFGATTVAVSLGLFVWPSVLIGRWPWPLTPLTARVVGATFILGGAGMLMARESRWSALRLLLQTQSVMLVLVLLAAVRASDEFTGPGAAGLFIGALVAVVAAVGGFYIWMERQRSHE